MADETQLLDDDRAFYPPPVAASGGNLAGHIRNARLASLRQVLRSKNAALSPTVRQDVAMSERSDEGDHDDLSQLGAAAAALVALPRAGPMVLGASTTASSPGHAQGRNTTRLDAEEPITPMVAAQHSAPQTVLSHISQTQDNACPVKPVAGSSPRAPSVDQQEGWHRNPKPSAAVWSSQQGSADGDALVMVAPSDPLEARCEDSTPSSSASHHDTDGEGREHRAGAVGTQHTLGCTLRVQDLSPRGTTLPTPQLTDDSGAGAAVVHNHRQVLGGGAPHVHPRATHLLPETVDDGILRATMTDEERDEFDGVDAPPGVAEEAIVASQGQEVELLLTEDDAHSNNDDISDRSDEAHQLSIVASEHPTDSKLVHPALVSAADAAETDAPLIPTTRTPRPANRSSTDNSVVASRRAAGGGSGSPPPPSASASRPRNAALPAAGAKGPVASNTAENKKAAAFVPGQLIEAKWGAVWYDAVVLSLLGKSVELQWKKDNSVVYVPMKDARPHKNAPAVPPPAAEITAQTPTNARRGVLSSTQLVRLMDEEDEQHNALRPPPTGGSRTSRHQQKTALVSNAVTPMVASHDRDATDGASPLPKQQQFLQASCSQETPLGEGRAAQHLGSNRAADAAADSAMTATPSSTLRRGPHQSDVLCDYGDCATPPSTLLYFTDAAVQAVPPETRRRCLRELPRVMVVHALSDVAAWAANSTYQQSVPFVFLASETALRDPASHEHFCIAVALALGITPLSCKWIAATLRSMSSSGGQAPMIPYEPYLLLPDSVRGTTRTAHHRQLLSVRLFPVPRQFRACFGDHVWCPQRDVDAELLIEAAGGSILRDVSEVLDRVEKLSQDCGHNISGVVPPRSPRLFLYTPPGRRMGSVLRDPRLENLVQLDLPWVRNAISRHFQQSISTRPVSCATAMVVSSGGTTATATTAPSLPKQASQIVPAEGRVVAPINRCLALEDSQQYAVAAGMVDDGGGASRKRHRDDDECSVPVAPHPHDEAAAVDPSSVVPHPSSVGTAPSQQQQHQSVPTAVAVASQLPLRRKLQHDLRIVVPRDEHSCSQRLPPLQPAIVPAPSSLIVPHDELTTTSTPNGYPVTVGDDYYFVLPMGGDGDADEGQDAAGNECIDDVMAMGRVAAVHAGGHVTMRLYELTSIALRRPKPERAPLSGGSGVGGDGATRGRQRPGALSTRRFTTMVLTEACVTVPTTSLDVETPLFVVDEHLLEHVYILQRRQDHHAPHQQHEEEALAHRATMPPAGHLLDGDAATPSTLSVLIRGQATEIRVGSVVECRAPPSLVVPASTTLRGHECTVHGVVQGFKRDEAVPDITFIVVGLQGEGDEPNQDLHAPRPAKPTTAVVTGDMIVSVAS